MNLFLKNYGESSTVDFVLYALDGVKFTSSVAFSTGDVKISKNGGAFANTTNLPVSVGNSYRLTLTATELQAADIQILISDLTTTQLWLDTALSINTYGDIAAMHPVFPSNVLQIDGDITSASNAKLGWNGVGVIGENLPATQGQVDNISLGVGGISTTATGVTITSGLSIGDYTDTFAFDGVYYIVEDDGGNTDFHLSSNVGGNGVATSVKLNGVYVQNNNDIVNVYGWNWVSSSWVQIGSLTGNNVITPQSPEFTLTNNMTGSDTNQGEVRLRFGSTNSDVVAIDQLLFVYTARSESIFSLHSGLAQGGSNNTIVLDNTASSSNGAYLHSRIVTTYGAGAEQENIITSYDGNTRTATVKDAWTGANPDATTGFDIQPAKVHTSTRSGGYDNNTVYVDLLNGNAGTEIGVNGTIDNPSNNMPDTRSIANNFQVNANRIEFVRSTAGVVLDQDYQSFIFTGRNPVAIDLGGFDSSLSSFVTLVVTGTTTNTNGLAVYDLCGIQDLDCGEANFLNCGLVGSLTMSQSGRPYSSVNMFNNRLNANSTTPEIIFNGDGVSPIRFEGNNQSGSYIIKGMKSVDILEIYGNCRITLDNTCSGGTFIYSGDVTIIDNSTVSPTFVSGVMKNTNTLVSSLNDISVSDILTTTMTEDYGVAGSELSVSQALYLAVQNLQDFSYSGTTQTMYKLDGTTTAATYTLDDAVTPTSKIRAT